MSSSKCQSRLIYKNIIHSLYNLFGVNLSIVSHCSHCFRLSVPVFRKEVHEMDGISTKAPLDQNSTYGDNLTASAYPYNVSDQPDIPPKITLSPTFLAVVFTVRIIWAFLAIAGNGLTILAVARFSSLQTSTNYLVASLAVGDLLPGLQAPVVILHQMLSDHPYFVPICLVEKTFSIISIRANYINILWISIDRLLYIAYPLKYPLWQTNQKTFTLIAVTWGYLIIENCLFIYFGHALKPGGICKVSIIVNDNIYDYYCIPQFILSLLITIVCYAIIARIAHKHSIAIAAQHQPFDTLEASIHRSQKKIAKMMFTVLASYLISYVPQIYCAQLLQNKVTELRVIMDRIASLIYFTNSFANPVIYAWKSQEFKEAFKKILHRKNSVIPYNAGAVVP